MTPSKEVADAIGEAPERPDYDALARRATELRALVAQPTAAAAELAAIEQQLAARKETEAVAAAKQRVKKLPSAVGSLLDLYAKEFQAVRDEVVMLRAAIEAVNARREQIKSFHDENDALADRFSLAPAKLAMPLEPGEIDTLPPFWTHRVFVPPKEWDEHHLRERRTYTEIEGTEAYTIITAAGLTWPPLTEAQRAAVAEREEDKRQERESMAEFAREAAHIVGVPDVQQFVPLTHDDRR
jgi:hypothetical protein